MTEDEARTIAAIATSADGGCIYCAMGLIEQYVAKWPEYDWVQFFGEADDRDQEWIDKTKARGFDG